MKFTTSILLLQASAVSVLAQCMVDEPLCSQINDLESTECTDFHVFLVRGSDSPLPGHQGELMKSFCDNINGTCGFENVDYPANSSFAGEDAWCQSAHKGAVAGQKQMSDYADKCEDAKLVLLGFSQGGSVALDILGGGGGPAFKCEQPSNPPLDRTTSPGNRLVAANAFGAVRRTGGMPFSVKDGKDFDGQNTRSDEQNDGLMAYADILRDYCNHGDGMCAVGSEPSTLEIHLNYFEKYGTEASQWLVKTAQNASTEKSEANGNGGNNDKDNSGEGTSAGSALTVSSLTLLSVATGFMFYIL